MKRREFLKSFGIVAGAGAVATTATILTEDKQTNLSNLANFSDARLRRRFEQWELTFSSSDKFDPSNKNQLIVEIGGFKFQLSGLDNVDISRFGKHGKYSYKLSGTGWESL